MWTTTKCIYACSGHRTKWSSPSERKVHGSGNSHHLRHRRQRQRPHVFQNFVLRQHQRELSRRYPTTTVPRPTDHRYRHWWGNCKVVHWLALTHFFFFFFGCMCGVWGGVCSGGRVLSTFSLHHLLVLAVSWLFFNKKSAPWAWLAFTMSTLCVLWDYSLHIRKAWRQNYWKAEDKDSFVNPLRKLNDLP